MIPSSQIDVLAEVAKAVNGRCEVYLDSGVRTGSDVLKAIALGARAVFIARPAVYALAYNVSDVENLAYSYSLHIIFI